MERRRRNETSARMEALAHARRSNPWIVVGVPCVVFLVAFTFFAVHIGRPSVIVFDEVYYAGAATQFDQGHPTNGSRDLPWNNQHPPVGKLLMWTGYALAGRPHRGLSFGEFGTICRAEDGGCERDLEAWRLPGAAVAALGVVGAYWIGRRLFGTPVAGGAAAAVLLLDPFYYVHARLAILDPYLVGFTLAAFGILLTDAPWCRRVAGILFGLALGTKYVALIVWPLFLVVAASRAPGSHARARFRGALGSAIGIPVAVFAASYTPFLLHWASTGGALHALEQLSRSVWAGLAFGAVGPDAQVPYESGPATWPFLRRPIGYYLQGETVGGVFRARTLYAIGNPLTWWVGLILVARWAWTSARGCALAGGGTRRFVQAAWTRLSGSASGQSMALLPALFVASYVPFFALPRGQFLYYFLFAAPYLSIAWGGLLGRGLVAGGGRRWWSAAGLVATALVFRFYWPVVSAQPLTKAEFEDVMRAIPWSDVRIR